MSERELRWHDLTEDYWDDICSMSCVHPALSDGRHEGSFPWEEEIQAFLSYIPFVSNPESDRIRISTRMKGLTGETGLRNFGMTRDFAPLDWRRCAEVSAQASSKMTHLRL